MKLNMIIINDIKIHIKNYINIQLIFLCILVLFTQSCTKVSLGYRLGSGEVRSRLAESFDFQPSNKSRKVDFALKEHFENNKKPVFVKIQIFLKSIITATEKKQPELTDVNTLFSQAKQLQIDIVDLFKPSFELVLTEIEDPEVKSFSKYYLKKYNEKKEELASVDSYKSKRIKSFKRIIGFIFDEINPQQEVLINEFVTDNIEYYRTQIEIRKKFNDDLIKLYPDKKQMIDLSLKYYKSVEDIRTADYKKIRAQFEDNLKKFVLSMWLQTTPKQKTYFASILKNIESEIESIIKK